MNKGIISRDSYKGVRDFYPEDKFILDYIKNSWRKTMRSYGYEEYDASILEPTELYLGKTSQEIVSEQTYTFTDRGDRSITLRPEMTPTVMRMVSKKRRELKFPLRWFSIPNVFRYEATQKGRLREHWQLNADLFGISNIDADLEMILLAHDTLVNLGLESKDFIMKINSRKIINTYLSQLNLEEKTNEFIRLLDKKDKIDNFDEEINKLIGQKINFDFKPDQEIIQLLELLQKLQIDNVIFDPYLARGFDYYTGIVFEAFSTNSEIKRSILGGGRYDKLSENYDEENLPVVGFGLGDVVISEILNSKKLLPEYITQTEFVIIPLVAEARQKAFEIASELRKMNAKVEIDISYRKIGQTLSQLSIRKIRWAIILGQDELKQNKFIIKDLLNKTQKKVGRWRLFRIAKKVINR